MNQPFDLQNLTTFMIAFLAGILIAIIVVLLLVLLGYVLVIFYRNRNREKLSLGSTLLQVSLPRDNEIKIDAAEQMFSSFASIRKGGRFSFLNPQPHLSFEVVGMPEDIRFYVNTPNN